MKTTKYGGTPPLMYLTKAKDKKGQKSLVI